MNVLLVYHEDLFRESLFLLISSFTTVTEVKAVSNASQVTQEIKTFKPSIVITQLGLPDVGGLEVTRRVTKTYPSVKTIIILDRHNDVIPSSVMKSGALGFLSLNTTRDNLEQAIKNVYCEQYYIDNDIGNRIAMSSIRSNTSMLDQLSLREIQVMLLLSKGQNIRHIATSLCLSPKTVSTYKYRLFHKLEVTSEVELAQLAHDQGLLEKHTTTVNHNHFPSDNVVNLSETRNRYAQ